MAARETRLAIVGASVRAAAESAIRGGFDVVAADLFADADLRAICPATRIADYPDGLRGWLLEQDVDAWMYTGALENSPDLVDEMAAERPLLGVSGEALRRARDPLFLQEVFRDAGVVFPETLPISQPPPGGGGWLAKTYRHSAGAGVAWLRDAEAPVYTQRFVEGELMSAVYAVGGGGATLLGMSVQLVGEPYAHADEWAYCGSIGPVAPTAAQTNDLAVIGEVLSKRIGLAGLVGVDLVSSEAALTVIEVNPRYTASMEIWERRFWGSAVADHVAACRGEHTTPWLSSSPPMIGKLVLFANTQAEVFPRFVEWLEAEHAEGRVADLPHEGEVIDAGRPVCTLLNEAEDIESVRERLRELAVEATRRLEANRG